MKQLIFILLFSTTTTLAQSSTIPCPLQATQAGAGLMLTPSQTVEDTNDREWKLNNFNPNNSGDNFIKQYSPDRAYISESSLACEGIAMPMSQNGVIPQEFTITATYSLPQQMHCEVIDNASFTCTQN